MVLCGQNLFFQNMFEILVRKFGIQQERCKSRISFQDILVRTSELPGDTRKKGSDMSSLIQSLFDLANKQHRKENCIKKEDNSYTLNIAFRTNPIA